MAQPAGQAYEHAYVLDEITFKCASANTHLYLQLNPTLDHDGVCGAYCRVSYFVVQYFFIVVAPVFFAAAIYIGLTRLITLGGRHISLLPPRVIFAIFLSLDIVTIIIQIAGAASIGSRESNGQDPTSANDILIAGLSIQTASFAVFLVFLLVSLARLSRHAKAGSDNETAPEIPKQRCVRLKLSCKDNLTNAWPERLICRSILGGP